MNRFERILDRTACLLIGGLILLAQIQPCLATGTDELVQIQSLSVNGVAVTFRGTDRPRLPAVPETVALGFGPVTNSNRGPLRTRFKLDGWDKDWREMAGEMRLSIRFFDEAGDHVGEVVFRATGQTEGWSGVPATASFKHRQELVVVPPRAKGFWVSLSSAGPPATVGVYCVTNLVIQNSGPSARVLVPWAFDSATSSLAPDGVPTGWIRDGLRPSMAQIIELDGRNKGFAIVDDDTDGHAEWHTLKNYAPPVAPGDQLMVTWDAAYSSGLAGAANVVYSDLPSGYFRFLVSGLSVSGSPTEAETSLAFEIPLAFWRTPWFWVSIITAAVASIGGAWRYLTWRRMQRELQRLEQQRAVERERLRIAQDIHDDLGARVTQISLLSAVAQRKPSLSEEARADFGTVSQMTRDLVSALYETVWAVNPENDNLEALGNYLCQLANQLCTPARLRCRLEVPDLPHNIPLTSQVRHNLIMAAKEALHNVVKHARASEARLRIVFEQSVLVISIHDDGCGFDPASTARGNGLENLRRRLQTIGGTFTLESAPRQGTTVLLRLPVAEG